MFTEGLQLRACAVLARLGPALLRLAQDERQLPSPFHPSLSSEEAARLIAELREENQKPEEPADD